MKSCFCITLQWNRIQRHLQGWLYDSRWISYCCHWCCCSIQVLPQLQALHFTMPDLTAIVLVVIDADTSGSVPGGVATPTVGIIDDAISDLATFSCCSIWSCCCRCIRFICSSLACSLVSHPRRSNLLLAHRWSEGGGYFSNNEIFWNSIKT